MIASTKKSLHTGSSPKYTEPTHFKILTVNIKKKKHEVIYETYNVLTKLFLGDSSSQFGLTKKIIT